MQALETTAKEMVAYVYPDSDLAKTLGLALRRDATLKECLKRPEVTAAHIAKALESAMKKASVPSNCAARNRNQVRGLYQAARRRD